MSENSELTPEEENVDQPLQDQAEGNVEESPAEEQPVKQESTGKTDAEIIAALKAEAADAKDKMLRAVAEAENVRRRAQAEIRSKLKFAHTEFARDLVAVADNLDRALSSVSAEDRKKDAALENLCVGVEMTARELETAFNKAGVTPVDAGGQKFDHNYHQAMFEIDDASQPSGTVLQVLSRGYMIHDRLLRPAMVGVSKGGPKEEGEAKVSDGEVAAAKAAGDTAYEKAAGETGGAGNKLNEEL